MPFFLMFSTNTIVNKYLKRTFKFFSFLYSFIFVIYEAFAVLKPVKWIHRLYLSLST